MEKVTLQKLESTLWKAADILRGELNAAEYKDFIFGMLFLKRMNDVFASEVDKKKKNLISQGIDRKDVNQILDDPTLYESFYIPKEARWKKLKDLNLNIGPQLDKAFRAIEDCPTNSELIGVLTTTDYNNKERVSDKKLSQLLILFDSINLSNENLEEDDMLGKTYEYLIKKFADEGGAKGGEFYTPPEVARLLVKLLKPQEGNRIYDPTVGSGGMLIQAMRYIKESGYNWKNVSLFGQEINISTWAICKMNMIFHDAKGADIKKGDTLRNPAHTEGGILKTFDIVIANPPFSLDNWGREEAENDIYNRYIYGIPPKSYGDLGFVSHMVASLNSTGRMGTVIPHGVLFRGGAEGKIREGIIKEDIIEA
ncbi:MAG: SAM-dependent DNA methyltransferase, partial [Actinobacteria bacterium]|nr:SAM-dependent DNA methyltransferase [Actinomycetota bacterium]